MSSRSHAVIIVPEESARAPAELAQLLAPIVGVPSGQLVGLLRRGPMTVEADLTALAAESLCQRLCRMGLPAVVEGGEDSGDPPASSADGSGSAPRVPQLSVDTSAELGVYREESSGEARYTPPSPAVRADDPMRGTLAGMNRDLPEADSGPVAAPPANSWGSLFPDIDRAPPERQERTSQGPPGVERTPVPPSLDDLESEPMTSRHAAPPPRPSAPARPPALPRPPSIPSIPSKPAPPRAAPEPAAKPPVQRPQSFDGARLASAFTPDAAEDRPPYAPTGFDDRLEHQPGLAALLSALAPGAGQIYNGDEDGLYYGLRFWMIRPWIESVRRAHARAVKIRTYWAPRPEPGAPLRALRYVVLWQLAVAASALILIWLGLRVYDLATREVEPDTAVADVARAMEAAAMDATEARVAALDAVAAERQKNPTPQFTMSDDERAERLYRIGYEHCAARNYEMCELVMRRVASLKSGHRGAFRLQAWAGVQKQSPRPTPMPDVGEVESLDEFEARQLSDEMGVPFVPVEEAVEAEQAPGEPEEVEPQEEEEAP